MAKKPRSRQQPQAKTTQHKPIGISSRWAWLAVAAVTLVMTLIRIHIINMPLERDEGKYAYMGQLMLHGVPPYVMAYNMKFPGIYAAYALIMAVFGQSIAGIHAGLIIANVATIVLIYLLGRRLFDRGAGIAAAAVYAVSSVGRAFLGMTANSEHFVVLPAVCGLLLLLDAVERGKFSRLIFGGLLLGLAVLVKQHGVMFAAFGACYVLWSELQNSRGKRGVGLTAAAGKTLTLVAATVAPFALTCAILWKAGAFPKFWFWTFEYARRYASEVTWDQGKQVLSNEIGAIWTYYWVLILLMGVGLVAPLWDKLARRRAVFTHGLFAFSCAAVSIGLEFRNHYFIFLIPASAILIGCGVSSLSRLAARKRLAAALPALVHRFRVRLLALRAERHTIPAVAFGDEPDHIRRQSIPRVHTRRRLHQIALELPRPHRNNGLRAADFLLREPQVGHRLHLRLPVGGKSGPCPADAAGNDK